jgi:hypothetical protein
VEISSPSSATLSVRVATLMGPIFVGRGVEGHAELAGGCRPTSCAGAPRAASTRTRLQQAVGAWGAGQASVAAAGGACCGAMHSQARRNRPSSRATSNAKPWTAFITETRTGFRPACVLIPPPPLIITFSHGTFRCLVDFTRHYILRQTPGETYREAAGRALYASRACGRNFKIAFAKVVS